MSLFEVIATMLYISHLSQMNSEENSLGQEDKIVIIEQDKSKERENGA